MATPTSGTNGRTRELLIYAAFAILCAAAVVTVLLPETQDDKGEDGSGAAAGTSASASAPTPSP
jgi:hypothetical protein